MYPIEIIGVVISLTSLVLEYRANRWFWLVSILASACYIYINFSSHIYANGTIQAYYLVTSLYGAIYWLKTKDKNSSSAEDHHLQSMPTRFWPWVISIVAVLTVVISIVLKKLGESQVAWLDGLSTALGVVAMVLMAKKYYQHWLLWICVEPLMIVMYFLNGNYPSSAMYIVYLVFAVMGYIRWKKLAESSHSHTP